MMTNVVRIPWPDLTKIDSVSELNRVMAARREQVQQFLSENAAQEKAFPEFAPLAGDENGWLPAEPVTQVRAVYAPSNSTGIYVDADEAVLHELADTLEVEMDQEVWMKLPEPVVTAAGEAGEGDGSDYLQQIGVGADILKKWTGAGAAVSVIDSGIDTNHKEFEKTQFKKNNSFDYEGDDPKAGIIKPIKLQAGQDYTDIHFHGSSVTGLLAGGLSGVARGCTVYSHNVFYKPAEEVARLTAAQGGGDVTRTRVEMAIMYSIIHRADIICMSLGVKGYDERFRREIVDANAYDRLIVAASGNNGFGSQLSPGDYPEVLAVGAVDAQDEVWPKTSAVIFRRPDGSEYAHPDIYAPGVDLRVAVPEAVNKQGYIVASGTSFSAPLVAGAAALIVGWYKEQGKVIKPAEVKEHLLQTADDIILPQGAGGGTGKRVNVGRAVEQLKKIVPT